MFWKSFGQPWTTNQKRASHFWCWDSFLSGFGSLMGAVSANSFDYFIYFKIFFAQELQTVGPISDRMYVFNKYIDDEFD